MQSKNSKINTRNNPRDNSYLPQRQEVECQIEDSQEYFPRDHPCEKWSTKEQVKA